MRRLFLQLPPRVRAPLSLHAVLFPPLPWLQPSERRPLIICYFLSSPQHSVFPNKLAWMRLWLFGCKSLWINYIWRYLPQRHHAKSHVFSWDLAGVQCCKWLKDKWLCKIAPANLFRFPLTATVKLDIRKKDLYLCMRKIPRSKT